MSLKTHLEYGNKDEDFTKHDSIFIQITSVNYVHDEITISLIEILLKNNNNVTFFIHITKKECTIMLLIN
jgi:hypothetical protein